MCTYLTKRGSTYYFRRPIPAELQPALSGRTQFMFSLRVKDRDVAKHLAHLRTVETDEELREAARRMAIEKYGSIGPETASEALISSRAKQLEEAMFDASVAASQFEHQEDLEQEARQEAREEERSYWKRRMKFTTRELTPREAAVKDLLADKDFDIEITKNEVRHLRMLLTEARSAGDTDLRQMRRTPAEAPAPAHVKTPALPLLSTFDAYAAETKIKPGTRDQWRPILERLVTFLGHDDATRVTADDLYRWSADLITETTKRGTPRSARTIKAGYIAAVSATLAWAVEKRKLQENVAATVVVRVPRKAKLRERSFTEAEASAILAATLAPAPEGISVEHARARRWIPWLCAYTGARVNEMSQLRGCDVEEREGIWTIRITPEAGTVKANAARIVPLHPHLVEQGFPAVAKAVGAGPLFYNPGKQRVAREGNRQFKKVGERLAEWVRSGVGITDPDLQPNHGWRHTFKTLALAIEMPERIADAIQGHAAKSVGRTYGSVPLRTMADAIGRLPRFSAGLRPQLEQQADEADQSAGA